MTTTNLVLLLLGLGLATFFYGRQKAYVVSKSHGGMRNMHSLPSQHGVMVAIWCVLPALLLVFFWKLAEPTVISSLLSSTIPASITEAGEKSVGLYKNDIANIIESGNVSNDPDKQIVADRWIALSSISSWLLVAIVLALAATGARNGFA